MHYIQYWTKNLGTRSSLTKIREAFNQKPTRNTHRQGIIDIIFVKEKKMIGWVLFFDVIGTFDHIVSLLEARGLSPDLKTLIAALLETNKIKLSE